MGGNKVSSVFVAARPVCHVTGIIISGLLTQIDNLFIFLLETHLTGGNKL